MIQLNMIKLIQIKSIIQVCYTISQCHIIFSNYFFLGIDHAVFISISAAPEDTTKDDPDTPDPTEP